MREAISKVRSARSNQTENAWALERFDMQEDVLTVRGWLFVPDNPNVEKRIAAYDISGKRLFEAELYPTYRPDLILHMGTVDAYEAGFERSLRIQTPRDVCFFLEFGGDDGVQQLPLGTVVANDPLRRYTFIKGMLPHEVAQFEASLNDASTDENAPRPCANAKLTSYLADDSIPLTIAFGHTLGGGAEHYLQERADACENSRFAIVRFDEDKSAFTCEAKINGCVELACYSDVETIFNSSAGVNKVLVNELVGYPNLASLLPFIIRFARENNSKVEFVANDYYALCMNYNLVDWEGKFCNLPRLGECERCFERIRRGEFSKSGIEEYRGVWEQFLLDCNFITAFSDSTKRLFERAYPSLAEKETINVVPNVVAPLRKVQGHESSGKTVIGVLGVLSHNKGLEVVKDIVALIDQNDTGCELVLIGSAVEEAPSIVRRQTGAYDRDDLPQLIEDRKVDIVLIPSICPETFSFTVSEAMDMGLPVVSFDVGAPADRVRNYDKGLVLPLDTEPETIIDEISSFARTFV